MAQNISFDVIARDKASKTFSNISRSSDSTMARLVKFGKSTAGLVGFTGLTTAAVGFIKVGADYSASLNKIQALSGATDTKMKSVAQTLQGQSSAFAKMGQTTGDAAGGVVELTKAGLSLDKSLKAVSATMVLAKAGELSVADASSLVANTLNTFHLKASRAADIANYLANAANISSADVTDLAESLKYVAPIAAATGVSLKQTNAILAELSNSGIAASNAGTGFRKFLLSLQAPSGAAAKDLKALGVEIFDAKGKMKPLGTVIDMLGGKLDKLTDEKRQRVLKDVFGLQGISSAQVIIKNGAKGLEEYTRGVGKAGAAQKLAESASKGFAGQLKQLKAEVLSSAQAAYRDMEPALESAAKSLTKFVDQMRSGEGVGGDFVAVLKETVGVAKIVLGFFNGLPGPVKKYGIELLIAAVALNKVNNSLVAGRVAIGKWMDSLGPAERQMTRTQRASYTLGVGLRNLAGAGGMLAVVDGAKRGDSALGALEVTAGAAAAGFAVGGPLGAGIGAAAGGLFSLYKATTDSGKAAKDTLPTWKTYGQTLDGVGAATSRATREMVLERLEKTGLLAKTQALNIADRDAVQAAMGNEAARKRVTAALADAVAKGKNYQALDIAQHLGAETTAIKESRVAQLKKNLALAATSAEAQKIQAKLDRLARTNANPRISIGGADVAISKLNAVLQLMHEVGSSRGGNAQLPKSGSLLGQLSQRATGGPVVAGQPYIVGERRAELFVPQQSGRMLSSVPTAPGMDHVALEQASYRAFSRALSDSRMAVVPRHQLSALDLVGA